MDYLSLNELLVNAEESERRARELRDQHSEKMTSIIEDEIKTLFNSSWQGYHEVEKQAREDRKNSDTIENGMLLAQALLDIYIHPDSGLVRDSNELWEAQYLWLHLYYRTGNQAFFNQAHFCDDRI